MNVIDKYFNNFNNNLNIYLCHNKKNLYNDYNKYHNI